MTPPALADRLAHCFHIARDALLAERSPDGHWVGELSTSALSTATAVMALEMMRRHGGVEHVDNASLPELIRGGLDWLAAHQNPDGGWGDTVKSLSNISTTMLARAVYRATNTEDPFRVVVDAAVKYIEHAGGVPAVIARYGKDRTFSVPILTHCALAGLVDWRTIPSLPFELACLPARFYKTVRLPVVSYALPALIAIGQVRYHFARPWNPVLRLLRRFAVGPSLRVLERIQPENGGFLEAAPLTSFATMSLAGMGLTQHPVAQRGLRFLIASVRPDGSWPIDTNLATWVTTLAVNALGDDLPLECREPILRWLMAQQYKTVHPYTNADPGGWAWTDLPGGVPDADDTPGASLAIQRLAGNLAFEDEFDGAGLSERCGTERPRGDVPGPTDEEIELSANCVRWLLKLQNRDGGWPTFCRGWGTLPFDRSSPDITAHVVRYLYCHVQILRNSWKRQTAYLPFSKADVAAPDFHPLQGINRARLRGFKFLAATQRPDGSWLPLWFGNQYAPNDENPTYGTTRVLAAYQAATWLDTPEAQRGLNWLRNAQNPDGGWGAGTGTPSSVEETALAVEILCADSTSHPSALRGLTWLMDRVEDGTWREPAPIGFYFARLWYFERLYPLIFTVAALRAARSLIPTLPGGAQPSPASPD
jgi:squalene-hopene/tetraprenyl-beta-curcumene cyclase